MTPEELAAWDTPDINKPERPEPREKPPTPPPPHVPRGPRTWLNNEKRCCRCTEMKPLEEYGRDTSRWDGLNRYCIDCKAAMNSEAYERRKSVPQTKQAPNGNSTTQAIVKPAATASTGPGVRSDVAPPAPGRLAERSAES